MLMFDADPVRQAKLHHQKKMQIFHLSLRGLSHHSEIVQKRSKKESQQHGLGIAEGGARTLDLEVGISGKIRATRSTD
jgi:hypothetical protein